MSGRASIEQFDSKRSEQYILSIRLSTDGFYFVVYNPQHYCFLLSEKRKPDTTMSYLANLKLAFRELPFLSLPYKQVYVLIADKRFTLVPLELFDDAHTQELFGYNYLQKHNEIICRNMLPNNNCVLLYGMDKYIHVLVNETHPEALYLSHIAVLTEYFSVKSRAAHTKQMFACLRGEYVDLYCFDRGRMSLVNAYGECKTPDDFSYYILLVWKQLGMSQLNDELYILGNTQNKSGLLEILKNFIKKVTEVEIEAELGNFFSESVKDVPYDMQIQMSQKQIG
ncbi:DUF3822 family protein [Bacteroides sp. 519]|uniref:DUF3822 family protein n=1 Tax=Bacteroides sp. 519 TaxID=2302937 RepID=UPI0013D43713|nr:DUF3822 family protein [Bacteroides sp. 519]NDV57134.1 DUF3822 family protein [Bacteroides sp. 519]